MTSATPPPGPPSRPPFGPPSGPPSFQPPTLGGAYPRPPGGRRGLGAAVIGFVAGLVVAALVVGILIWTDTIGSGDSTSGRTSGSQPVSMPAELGGLKTQLAVTKAKADQKEVDAVETRLAHMRSLTEKQYAEVYPGAGIGVEAYANDSLDFMPVVVAIRADSTPIVANVVATDPSDAGLAVNQSEIRTSDGVRCLVYHVEPTPVGQKPDPEKVAASLCQRTGDGFTVFVSGGGGEGSAEVARMVDLTNAAYDDLHG